MLFMVSITFSIPEETRKIMKEFPEINWTHIIRSSIEEKAKKLVWKEKMLKQIKEEDEGGFTDWTIEMGRKLKKDVAKKHIL